MRGRALRHRLALALIVAASLVSAARLVHYAIDLRARSPGRDEVTAYEARLAPLRPLLPGRGVVGYLSDRPGAVKELYLTQYALAPVLLQQTPGPALVIGNFFDPQRGARVVAEESFVVVREFGKGLWLLRRGAP